MSFRGGVVRVLGDPAVFVSSVQNEEAQINLVQREDTDTRDEERFDPHDENGLRALNRGQREAFETRFKKSTSDQMAETYDPTTPWSADSLQLLTPEEKQKRKEEGTSNKRAYFYAMNRAVDKTNRNNIEEKKELHDEVDSIRSYMATQQRRPNADEQQTLNFLDQQINEVDRAIRETSAKKRKILRDMETFENEQIYTT